MAGGSRQFCRGEGAFFFLFVSCVCHQVVVIIIIIIIIVILFFCFFAKDFSAGNPWNVADIAKDWKMCG